MCKPKPSPAVGPMCSGAAAASDRLVAALAAEPSRVPPSTTPAAAPAVPVMSRRRFIDLLSSRVDIAPPSTADLSWHRVQRGVHGVGKGDIPVRSTGGDPPCAARVLSGSPAGSAGRPQWLPGGHAVL